MPSPQTNHWIEMDASTIVKYDDAHQKVLSFAIRPEIITISSNFTNY